MLKTFNTKHILTLSFFCIILTMPGAMILRAQPAGPNDTDALIEAAHNAVNAQVTRNDPSNSGLLFVSTNDLIIMDNWAFGMVIERAPADDHGSPWLHLFVARRIDGEWQVAAEGTSTFTRWLAQSPQRLLPGDSRNLLLSPAPETDSSFLSLPYATGESWKLSGGPHSCCTGDPSGLGAVDMAGGTGMVRAAREGTVWRSPSCPNFIRVDHEGGWQTGYYHLYQEQVLNGQSVARGQYLGNQGNGIGCGGWSSGAHVHFSLRRYDIPQTFNNHDVGGWVILAGAAQYDGCMRRISDNVRRCVGELIYNNGAIGNGSGIPLAPPDIDLMTNGDFAGQFVGWDTAYDTEYNIQNGILNWYGTSGGDLATINSVVNYTAPTGAVVELQLDMGNSSSVTKRIRAHVQAYNDSSGGVWNDGLLVCEFSIPPNTPLQTYTLRREINSNWPQMRVWIEGYPADGQAAILTDNVELYRRSGVDVTGTECIPPDLNLPGPITRITPINGGIVATFTDTVPFQWQEREDTLWYHVYIVGGNVQVIFDQWYNGADVCDAEGICTVPQSPLLYGGAHDWWMAGWNEDGIGDYNRSVFSVQLDPPGLIQRTAPIAQDATTLTWTHDPLALWYHLYLAHDNAVVINAWYEADEVCDAMGSCTVDAAEFVGAAFEGGHYDWWMAGWGPGDLGDYDNVPFDFALMEPGTIYQLSPEGNVPSGTIGLIWHTDPQAQWYHVYVVIPEADDFDQWYNAADAAVCGADTCEVLLNLTPGHYDWWMAGWGNGLMGPYTHREFDAVP